MSEFVRVLYVEDEPDIRAVAEFALEDEGFVLTACASGAEALERGAKGAFDLILIDVMMPTMDGPTTLQHLRGLSHLAETPAIFMTAKVQPSEVAQYLEWGAKGVIAKPFNAMGLADEIRAILGRG